MDVPITASINYPAQHSSSIEDIIKKMKQFLKLMDAIVDNYCEKKIKLEAQQYSDELKYMIRSFDNNQTLMATHAHSGITLSHRSEDNNDTMKVISDLEDKNEKLTSLLSQHETANIKMFIEMNEGKSFELE